MRTILLIALISLTSSVAYSRDIVQKKSGERIFGKIDSVDSASVTVMVLREGGNPTRSTINRSDIEFFAYDYNESELLEAPKIENKRVDDPDCILSMGLLQGSSLIAGADLEFKLCDYLGAHAGFGIISADAGVDIHFSPTIRSSCLSLQAHYEWFYFSRGISIVPTFIYRSHNWFTGQIGYRIPIYGYSISKESSAGSVLGPVYISLGAYIPW
ncbi:MAG: hypothetical protein ACM3U1_06300 [Chloroflexota bacterium]